MAEEDDLKSFQCRFESDKGHKRMQAPLGASILFRFLPAMTALGPPSVVANLWLAADGERFESDKGHKRV